MFPNTIDNINEMREYVFMIYDCALQDTFVISEVECNSAPRNSCGHD